MKTLGLGLIVFGVMILLVAGISDNLPQHAVPHHLHQLDEEEEEESSNWSSHAVGLILIGIILLTVGN